MQFIELDPEDFRKFAAKSPYKSFYQTPEIAALREKSGWTPYYFGVKKDGKLKAATMLVARPAFLGKSVFYAPGGPLLDLEDTVLTKFFFRHLKQYAKTHNGYVLHIEPYYERIERDIDGAPVPGGFNHKKAVKNLQDIGFIPLKTSDEPKYLFVLPIKNRQKEELFAACRKNTRNHIRKAEKKGVTIRELEKSELSRFKALTDITSKRRSYTDKPLSYYETMYDLFHHRGEVKFILAEADGHDLSATMFMLYGDEITSLFSGSDKEFMRDYNAQYLIKWHMIEYAAEHGFAKNNFYGINGLPDPSSPDYGIYDYKKGFGGHVVELIGAHELPLSPVYYLHRFLSKFKF